eukprot:10665569-Karenia_brevis.AAC.1
MCIRDRARGAHGNDNGKSKLPRTTLVKFNCAARLARGAHSNENGKWQALASIFAMALALASLSLAKPT